MKGTTRMKDDVLGAAIFVAAFIFVLSIVGYIEKAGAACPTHVGPVPASQVKSAQNFPSLGFFVIRLDSPWYSPKVHKVYHTDYAATVKALSDWDALSRCRLNNERPYGSQAVVSATAIRSQGSAPVPLFTLYPVQE